ncbi:sporangia-induced kinesin-like protein [Achlya hypogyna]|uniref:Kinesin-like protein n=1 Tax=Achlya hypogyna TaxID=1202772 RepID=A0A1V9Y9H6_ACHHY|nr:sporangia-induced kinesin-like protein [Achlya hypogyna]
MPVMEPDDGAPLLPIPEWMKAKARVVSTQSVTWQKPAMYHSSTNPLRMSSSGSLKPPTKLAPLPDMASNQQQHALETDVPCILKSMSCPPSLSPAKALPVPLLAPIPTCAGPTFVHQIPKTEAYPEETGQSAEPEQQVANVNIPIRQSRVLSEVAGSMNKWRARAIANPFAKRKTPTNNEMPSEVAPVAELSRHTPIIKSSFKMQPTNQEESVAEIPAACPPRKDEPMTRRPESPKAPPRTPSPPPSLKWDGEMAPQPKKALPKRPVKGKSSCVGALAEIQRKREERRAMQAQEKTRKEKELKEHGDDAGYKFRRLIKAFRATLPPRGSVRTGKMLTGQVDSKPRSVGGSSKLCVYVRKRPLSKKELAAKGYDVITCTQSTQLLCHEPKLKVDMSESLENHSFAFDGVFDETDDNDVIYKSSVGPLIPSLVQSHGILTVFAYGQTGSGKTYTMKSVYRQAAADLFAQLVALNRPVIVGVSFYDIYKNGVCDLLNQRKKVQALEDNEGVVQLLGLTEVPTTSGTMLMDLVERGEASRITSINGVHDDSSRSHAILRVTLYSGKPANGQMGTVEARLSMVDLAGSERACETQTDDKSTRMEGAEINKSLLALKECIRAMDIGAKHLPFRQSKLTQILRDSFMCETSRTVMIATVSPCSEHSNHTLNTLRYADRLKEINSRDDQ